MTQDVSPAGPAAEKQHPRLMVVLRGVAISIALVYGALIMNAYAGWWDQCTQLVRTFSGTEATCAEQAAGSGADGIAIGYVGFVLAIAPTLLFGKTTYDFYAGLCALISAGIGFLEFEGNPTGPVRVVAVVSFAIVSIIILALKELVEWRTQRSGAGRLPSLMPLIGLVLAVAIIVALAAVSS